MALLDCFMILNNEEELVQYALDSFVSFGDLLGVLSIVDNNSTDATLEIVEGYRDRLNIVLQHEHRHSHHGKMRTMAMEPLTQGQWIFYLDGDEQTSANFPAWLRSGAINESNCWQIYKYTTIIDRFHYVEGGNGPTQRLFRNLPGRHFPQSIHTEPTHPEFRGWREVPGVFMCDATAIKSYEALWMKSARYQWAFREKVPAIGPLHEYYGRVKGALDVYPERNKEFPPDLRQHIFTGPDAVPGHPGIPWSGLK